MYKEDLALNNLQWFMCHKTQPNQIIYIYRPISIMVRVFVNGPEDWGSVSGRVIPKTQK